MFGGIKNSKSLFKNCHFDNPDIKYDKENETMNSPITWIICLGSNTPETFFSPVLWFNLASKS